MKDYNGPGKRVLVKLTGAGHFFHRANPVIVKEIAEIIEKETGVNELTAALEKIIDKSEHAPPIHALREIGEAILEAKEVLKRLRE